MGSRKRVAIIGGGASGLISTKTCLEDGLEPVCFELTTNIGGLWNYSTSLIENKGSVMKSTVINSCKENMAFSDFPAPDDYPIFMHNTMLMDYFRLYAKHFKLYEHIKFSTKVLSIKQADNYDETGQWSITYKTKDENEKTEIFDAVMICVGHHARPNIPIIDSLNGPNKKFKGEVIHVWQYKDAWKYSNKRVLVIGVGNSGGDVAVELSRIASRAYLSTRTGMWCLPRTMKRGMPTDYLLITRYNNFLQSWFPKYSIKIFAKLFDSHLDHSMYGIRPNHNKMQHGFTNDDLPSRIATGTLVIKSNYKEFDGNKCVFDDGSVVDNIDAVILATGYSIGFPLLGDSVIQVKDNWVNLYKYVFPPQLKHPTLAVMGCVQPLGSTNPITELQARWATRVFRGLSKLPSQQQMEADIKFKEFIIKLIYNKSLRHTIQVNAIPFMDEIAELVGCKPNLTKYFFTDHKLWKMLIFYGLTPYQYRLNGPGSNYEQASKNIMTQNERIAAPFKTRIVAVNNDKQTTSTFKKLTYLTVIGFVGYSIYWKYYKS